jgi:hypothetical protein
VSCARCKRDNRAHRRYCGGCGDPLVPPCPGCGFDNEPDDRFCGGCGDGLAAAAPARAVVVTPGHAVIAAITQDELAELLAPMLPEVARLPDAAIDQDALDRLFGGAS